ncbi:hypothetical protein M406DRAFT_333165 [Cryphonectria parasitica EP155]|uniref:Protein kinase domain-containing protein n=1 Tax=Cryphonectria parasitica (strain ATCC 38755 / EP155) TaxID=660469 RepID=A0A9P4XXG1_CRYP1|nr:uncharacterized protein M406DRAFT_333165 [Cryphonectria parasitica EP155]KAF3762793.1 hypothetical protein M406DRAFT_333165 [Cryphonectria parasitica EP155]
MPNRKTPNPNEYRRKSAAFYKRQLQLQDRFDFYRRLGLGKQEWSAKRRAKTIARRRQPARNGPVNTGFPGPDSKAARDVRHRAYEYQVEMLPTIRAPLEEMVQLPDGRVGQSLLSRGPVRDLMARSGLRFVKVLGWGANGIVTLWALRETTWNRDTLTEDEQIHNIVLKSIQGGMTSQLQMDNERRIMDILGRAPHIMQRFNLESIVNKPNARRPSDAGERAPRIPAAGSLDRFSRFLWMRFARFGELDEWIRKVRSADKSFPKAVLWQIFECLVNGCVAMAVPPRCQTIDAAGLPLPLHGPDLDEALPRQRISLADGYINITHFDLDLQNEDGDHPDVPRLQIADFGFATTATDFDIESAEPVYNDYTVLWECRDSGKPLFYTPEQYTKEWDNVNYEPFSEGFSTIPPTESDGAAGAFSEKTNIFNVALMIRCCITFLAPNCPPVPTHIPRSARWTTWTGWTYGGDLVDRRKDYGSDMCDLLLRCLAHQPSRRPDLRALRAAVARGVARCPVKAADRQWVTDTLFGPGRSPSAVPIPATADLGARVALG